MDDRARSSTLRATDQAGPGRQQRQHGKRRLKATFVRLSEEEHALLAAAKRVDLSLASYVGVAAVAAAQGTEAPGTPITSALHELMQARTLLGRVNGNLNKLSAAALAGARISPLQLSAAIEAAARTAARLDAIAGEVQRRIR